MQKNTDKHYKINLSDDINIITSLTNSKIVYLKKLYDKKYRDEYNQYVAEGLTLVKDMCLIDYDDKLVDKIFISKKNKDMCQEFSNKKDKVFLVEEKIFEKISLTTTTQGVLAIVNKSNSCLFSEFDFSNTTSVLYLDRIRDPGNLGTIIRTCCACGFNNIILDNCVDAFNPKVIRSTMSGILKVNLFDKNDCNLNLLKKNKFKVVACDMNGTNIFKFTKMLDKYVLVIGNEATGVSEEIKELSDDILSLPMKDIESLNASVSASVIMYILKNR